MLAEFLRSGDPGLTTKWNPIMPGVEACHFRMALLKGGSPISLPVQLHRQRYEAFFCRSGSIMLRQQGGTLTMGSRDILLLAQPEALRSVQIAAPLDGVLVSVNTALAQESRQYLCSLLERVDHNSEQLRTVLGNRRGCVLLHPSQWSRSTFSALEALSPLEQGSYCILKTMELLYLLCTGSPLLEEESQALSSDSYLTRTVADMRTYMEGRLDEKLTIEAMSRKFHISPTAFKSCFRRLYGQPVHQWLQACRMKRAAELLHTTPMTVLQIAQAVGYDGGSQFNVAFKRQFGVTPRQYKKLSDPMDD